MSPVASSTRPSTSHFDAATTASGEASSSSSTITSYTTASSIVLTSTPASTLPTSSQVSTDIGGADHGSSITGSPLVVAGVVLGGVGKYSTRRRVLIRSPILTLPDSGLGGRFREHVHDISICKEPKARAGQSKPAITGDPVQRAPRKSTGPQAIYRVGRKTKALGHCKNFWHHS